MTPPEPTTVLNVKAVKREFDKEKIRGVPEARRAVGRRETPSPE
jgi:hypothetical protein